MGLAIKNGNGHLFFSVLPHVAVFFAAMKKSNYTNATFLMHINYKHWLSCKFSFLKVFDEHFKAFSEERGESSIHLLLKQINDFNIDLDSLDKKYQNVAAFTGCYSVFNFPLSFKASNPKSFSLDPEDFSHVYFDGIYITFLEIVDKIRENQYMPYIPSRKGLNSFCPKITLTDNCYADLNNNFDSARQKSQKKLFSILKNLKEKYRKPISFPWDLPLAVWKPNNLQ